MADVAGSLRNEYSLGYISTNQNHDGKYRKIKVELVNADGGPCRARSEGQEAEVPGLRPPGLRGSDQRQRHHWQLNGSARKDSLNNLAPNPPDSAAARPLNQRSRFSISNSALPLPNPIADPAGVRRDQDVFESPTTGFPAAAAPARPRPARPRRSRVFQARRSSASWSTSDPRATFTRIALGFISASCSAPIMWCVSGVSGAARIT